MCGNVADDDAGAGEEEYADQDAGEADTGDAGVCSVATLVAASVGGR